MLYNEENMKHTIETSFREPTPFYISLSSHWFIVSNNWFCPYQWFEPRGRRNMEYNICWCALLFICVLFYAATDLLW